MRKVKKLLRDSRQTQVITVIFPSVLWETLLQFLRPFSQDPQGQNFSKYYRDVIYLSHSFSQKCTLECPVFPDL